MIKVSPLVYFQLLTVNLWGEKIMLSPLSSPNDCVPSSNQLLSPFPKHPFTTWPMLTFSKACKTQGTGVRIPTAPHPRGQEQSCDLREGRRGGGCEREKGNGREGGKQPPTAAATLLQDSSSATVVTPKTAPNMKCPLAKKHVPSDAYSTRPRLPANTTLKTLPL